LAESLITGDEDLLVLNPFRNIKIITALEFLDTHSISWWGLVFCLLSWLHQD